jgi:hypothetical protein
MALIRQWTFHITQRRKKKVLDLSYEKKKNIGLVEIVMSSTSVVV